MATTEVDYKVDLELKPWTGFHNRAQGPRPSPVKRTLPYCHGVHRGRLHRVRSAMLHHHSDGSTHISVSVWCGNAPSKVRFYPAGTGYHLCPRCEEKAVANGQPPASELPIAMRWHEMFPRT